MKKAVILGGGGFIGSHLADELIKHDYEVTLFNRPHFDRKNVKHLTGQVAEIEGDFNNESDVERAIKGQPIVFHLVGTTSLQSSAENIVNDLDVNVLSSVRLLEKSIECGVKKIVFVSSGGTVYGPSVQIPIRENHPLNPICAYGLSKSAIEQHLCCNNYLQGLDYAVLRFANPYGKRQNTSRKQGAICTFLEKLYRNEPVEIWGDGSVVRDYVYISDAVKALRLAAECRTKEKTFNVGTGTGYSLNEIKAFIEKETGGRLKVMYKAPRSFDVPVNVLDVSLIREVLGWQSRTTLVEGIQKTWEWINSRSRDELACSK
ncbi:NAD-dependent epimerase/dehydratase family protein [Patescibacteria group bacterium]|nr:NAD-dependent epimerase/dehydratase family protein [Patescibacteria group bacterium]